jgi:hypothetical protein
LVNVESRILVEGEEEAVAGAVAAAVAAVAAVR